MAPIDLIACLVSDELTRRADRLLDRRRKLAGFRDPDRTLDNFDFTFNPKTNRSLVFDLATGAFISKREDALFLGPGGTGKSHLAQAIGQAAILQGYKVLYRETHVLLDELAEAVAEDRRRDYIESIAILCSDRCASYLKYHKGDGQFCWAHFKRNILGVQEVGKTTDAQRFCRDALALHAQLFRLWHRFRDGPGVRYGPLTRDRLIAKSIPLEKKFFALANRYLDSRDKDVANLALALLQHFERFFAFLRHEGVEPTNNVAERALRCAVQWRKISFGSRSVQGEVAVARLLTVTRTCRMQNRVPLDYLVTVLASHRSGLSAPSLLK
jgi:hypothetical protein